MTKKKVEVNEDILKNIIVGDIPVFGREQPMNENTEQPGQESVPVKNPEHAPAIEPVEIQSEKTPPVKPRKRKMKRVAIGTNIWLTFRHPTVPMSI
ncbi:hypothetical protein NXX09_20000 [Bacteroides uniformis]|nr:hypothetical protein [Bacteroides uniformis]